MSLGDSEALTAEDGRFAISFDGPGSTLKVDHPRYLLHVSVVEASAAGIEVRLDRGESLFGRVTDHAGRPREGVWVRAGGRLLAPTQAGRLPVRRDLPR